MVQTPKEPKLLKPDVKAKYKESNTIHRIRARTVKKPAKDVKTWNPAGKAKKEPEYTDEDLRKKFRERTNRNSVAYADELDPSEKERLRKRNQSLKEKGINVGLRDMYIEDAAVEEVNRTLNGDKIKKQL